jgi:hypothetical protein
MTTGSANLKSKQKQKAEPSLRDKLSQGFLKALEEDFRLYGTGIIEKMRKSDPSRYIELCGKLVMTVEQPDPDSFASARSMEELGRKLLKSVGTDENMMTDDMVEAAITANDHFIERLEQIRDAGQGAMQ